MRLRQALTIAALASAHSLELRAQARGSGAVFPSKLPIAEPIQAVAVGESAILAWSDDSLRVVRIDSMGRIQSLLVAAVEGVARDRRVMQLTSFDDTILVRLSDRRTEFVIPMVGPPTRRMTGLSIPSALRSSHSAIARTRDGSTLLVPLLLPATNFGTEKDAVLLSQGDRLALIDSVMLGARIVQVEMSAGQSLLYDSPMRALHDVGSRYALTADGELFVAVDTRLSSSRTELSIRRTTLQIGQKPTADRWYVSLPLIRITDAEWRNARDSAVRTMHLQFANLTIASEILGGLATPGGPLPPVRGLRVSPKRVLLELSESFAVGANLGRYLVVTSEGYCSMHPQADERLLAIGERTVWSIGRSAGKRYVRVDVQCDP